MTKGLHVARLDHDGVEHVVFSVPIRVPAAFAHLSPSELEVIEAILEGKKQRAIASARGVSVRTVMNQLARAYRKLGVGSANELAVLVREAAEGAGAASEDP